MIDLHCHLLPGIDDGAENLAMSLEMARIASHDGITVTACTPHILPTVYDNTGPAIRASVTLLQNELVQAGISLRLVAGADVGVAADVADGLKDDRVLTLNNSRYLLLEPPHYAPLPQLEEYVFKLQAAGFIGIITHPERLTWIETRYGLIERMVHNGAWVQLTAGSLMGRFGRRPRYWAERMLDEGLCHVLATDAHNTSSRAPLLAEARNAAAKRVGEREAMELVLHRPRGVIDNVDPAQLSVPMRTGRKAAPLPLWKRVLTSARGGA